MWKNVIQIHFSVFVHTPKDYKHPQHKLKDTSINGGHIGTFLVEACKISLQKALSAVRKKKKSINILPLCRNLFKPASINE